MAFDFKFPDVGEGLTEGEIVEWKVKVGDRVQSHQVLLEAETDKAVVEIPAPREGFILSLKGGPGDIIRVGEVIASIGDEAEAKSAPARASIPAATAPPVPPPAPRTRSSCFREGREGSRRDTAPGPAARRGNCTSSVRDGGFP